MTSYTYDQASNQNCKPVGPKEGKRRQQEERWAESSDTNLNEREIMEKIGRINRLNEEINTRLQRMLTKIDQP